MIDLVSLLLGVTLGGLGVFYQGRADRRDAARYRRQIEADARANLWIESTYHDDLLVIHNKGPADASRLSVKALRFGPRSRMKPEDLLGRWTLPPSLPAEARHALRVMPREGVRDWIELTLEWENADGKPGTRTERVNWG